VVVSSILCTVGGCSAGLLNYWDQHDYLPKSTEATVTDDMWISTEISGNRSHFCIPLLFGYVGVKQPFRAGVMVVDYENSNRCSRVDVISLTLEQNGKKKEFVSEDSPISFPFYQYVEGVAHVKSDALINLRSWLHHKNTGKIRMKIKFEIHREGKEPLEQEIEEEFTPYENKGLFLFHEFLDAS
jgi:hypothetical protein